MKDKIFSVLVPPSDTVASIATFLLNEKSAFIDPEALDILHLAAKNGVNHPDVIVAGQVQSVLITPAEFGYTTRIPEYAFLNHASDADVSLQPLPVHAAMRLLPEIPIERKTVRCAMLPVPDENGIDFIFTFEAADGKPWLRTDYSGLYDATFLVDPEQPYLFRYCP